MHCDDAHMMTMRFLTIKTMQMVMMMMVMK